MEHLPCIADRRTMVLDTERLLHRLWLHVEVSGRRQGARVHDSIVASLVPSPEELSWPEHRGAAEQAVPAPVAVCT